MDLRKAAEMALEALEGSPELLVDWLDKLREVREALRQALAQPEQGNSNSNYPNTKANTSLKHEPWCDSVTKLLLSFPPQIPPCNCKPKREWVGLTADEIWKCNKAETGGAVEFHICVAHQNVLDFAEAIEAKLKEKNGG